MINNDFVKAAFLFSNYARVGESNSSAEKAKEYICKRIPDDLYKCGISEVLYKVKGTVGQGRTVEVPWVAIMRRSITTSTTRGIYIVYLFSADMKRVILSFMLGCEYFAGMGQGKSDAIRKIAGKIANMIDVPDGFSTSPISLGGRTSTNKEYERAHILGTEYLLYDMPSPEQMQDDLRKMLTVYEQFVLMMGKRNIDEFYDYVDASADGLVIEDERHFSSETVSTDNVKTTSNDNKVEDSPEKKRKAIRNERGELKYPRSEKKSSNALESAQYKCEYDIKHFSFYSKKNEKRMYVEAHHLVPLNNSEEFENSLDVETNIVSLCPNCHRCIHNGSKHERNRIVTKLYEQRSERLNKAGIGITLDHLLAILE